MPEEREGVPPAAQPAGGEINDKSGDNEEKVDAEGAQGDACGRALLPAEREDAHLTNAVRINDEEGGNPPKHLYGIQFHGLSYICKYMNRFIVVTGAAGFIGSDLVGYLNEKGYTDLILVDEFGDPAKEPNLAGKKFAEKVEREIFFDWLKENRPELSFVFHIGARTDTTEFDYAIHERLNVEYSKKIWTWCTGYGVLLVYAFSA